MQVSETSVNVIAEGSELQGEFLFDQITRMHGHIKGKVRTKDSGVLILGESGVIEGDVEGDTVVIAGFVQGNVRASTSVTVSASGRVLGNIDAPSVQMDFGAHFEGSCQMSSNPALAT